jgi:hypothetical protein
MATCTAFSTGVSFFPKQYFPLRYNFNKLHPGCEQNCTSVLTKISIFQQIFIHSFIFTYTHVPPMQFIHLVVCLTTGPKPLPNRALHMVRSSASSFKCEYPLLSLRSSSSSLCLLPRLPVTSIPPFIFPSITRCRRQFLRKM